MSSPSALWFGPWRYVLRVELLGVEPAPWRSLSIPDDVLVPELATVLALAMGWGNSHMHEFRVEDVRFGFGPELPVFMIEATDIRLSQILSTVGSRMIWTYDFGDGWEHDLNLIDSEPRQYSDLSVVLLDGGNACPPDDCGGPWGYADIKEALAHPDDADPDLLGWVPPGFDPSEFALARTAAAVSSLALTDFRQMSRNRR